VSALEDTGIVLIARNEGERLVRCLASCEGEAALVVYADSASTDGSVERARGAGVAVVELDPARPMNASRGRNAGLARLLELRPDLRYVLFLDGDCELVRGFVAGARAALEADGGLAAVCGRRSELHPGASLYNRLVDTEWNTPVGEALACGGDVLVRVEAIRAIGGYDEAMSCGEDPEMSFRLRERGWRLRRLPLEMSRHDVGLTRFSAWWRRHGRGGYAYAHGAWLHLHGPEWFQLARCLGILFWGLLLPLVTVALAWPTGGASLVLLAAGWGWLFLRVRSWRRGQGDEPRFAGLYAAFVVVGKVAEAFGILRFLAQRLLGRRSLYVDYKEYQATG